MKTVKVNKEDLLQTVKANRDKHREVFEKALANYREFVIEELESMIADARDNKPIRTTVKLHAPIDHTKDYDRVVRMLEMSVSIEVDLDEQEFSKYVQDDWEWSEFANMLNNTYAAKMKPSM